MADGMADGMAKLDAQIRKLRELGTLVKDSAPEVAKAVDGELRAQIARGVGPDGAPLEPTKDGRQPLKNAGKALRVRAIGTVVLSTLSGPAALHNSGRARGGVRRQILPSGKIPEPVTKAITKIVTDRFRKTMTGSGS